jgi:hypothetical protein
MTMQKPLRVIQAYHSAFTDPLIARQGDQLRFERRESEWPGWIWCTDPSGRSGWVPESWVELGTGVCTLKRDYAATELSVEERAGPGPPPRAARAAGFPWHTWPAPTSSPSTSRRRCCAS